jgi:hypothetical protein
VIVNEVDTGQLDRAALALRRTPSATVTVPADLAAAGGSRRC